MRMIAAIAAMAAASAATAASMTVANEVNPLRVPDLDFFPREKRGKGQNNRRGKGKSNPPKKRSNRLLISKRVRRKHRRRAA